MAWLLAGFTTPNQALTSSYNHTSLSVCVHACFHPSSSCIHPSLHILMSQSSFNQRQFGVPIFLRGTNFEAIGHLLWLRLGPCPIWAGLIKCIEIMRSRGWLVGKDYRNRRVTSGKLTRFHLSSLPTFILHCLSFLPSPYHLILPFICHTIFFSLSDWFWIEQGDQKWNRFETNLKAIFKHIRTIHQKTRNAWTVKFYFCFLDLMCN